MVGPAVSGWGSTWLSSFAAEHGKPIAFPEWSDDFRSDGHGLGDDPYFINQFSNWIASNNVAFTDIFAFDGPGQQNNITDGSFPNALAAFKTDFGGASATLGSSPAPAPAPTTTTTRPPTSGNPASTTPSSAPHVMIVMMENESASSVIGNSQMPFTNSLATDYGDATNSFAMAHPSLPNYLTLVSGSAQGVTQDQPPSSGSFPNAPTIANQLSSAGLTVGAYAENLPSDPSNDGGASDSSGNPIYAVRHAPLGTGYFPHDGVTIKDASTLTGDLNGSSAPDFVFFTPNLIDDGHDGSPSQADSFLSNFVPEVQSTSWYADGGQIIVEWDEGADSDTAGIGGGDGGHIPTIVVSAALKANPQQDPTQVDTIGILHSVEAVYGLPTLGGSSADGDISALLSAAPAAAAAPAPAPVITTPAPAPVEGTPTTTSTTTPTPTTTAPATPATTTPPPPSLQPTATGRQRPDRTRLPPRRTSPPR